MRKTFHQELEDIDTKVVQLFALVTESLAAATETLLAGDRDNAMAIKKRDQIIDDLNEDLQSVVERNLLLQAPVAGELRFLLSVLRIVPELERSHFGRGIGPGVYDIHSPRVPSVEEVTELLEIALASIPERQVWVNPDCGLKTRGYTETVASLENVLAATRAVREKVGATK